MCVAYMAVCVCVCSVCMVYCVVCDTYDIGLCVCVSVCAVCVWDIVLCVCLYLGAHTVVRGGCQVPSHVFDYFIALRQALSLNMELA